MIIYRRAQSPLCSPMSPSLYQQQLMCPSIEEWMKKLRYFHIITYNRAAWANSTTSIQEKVVRSQTQRKNMILLIKAKTLKRYLL